MKVVYHERFTEVYCHDPASAAGRMESVHKELRGHFKFVRPQPAKVEDLKLVHSDSHIRTIQRMELTGIKVQYGITVLLGKQPLLFLGSGSKTSILRIQQYF